MRAQVGLVRRESQAAGTNPAIEALVQVVEVTDDRMRALADLSDRLQGVPLDVLDNAPYVLVGTVQELAAQLVRHAQQFGISRYVVREPAVDAMGKVPSLLKGH